MGRFECDEEDFPGQSALWERTALNTIQGKRGRVFLRELETALLAMPERRLCEGLASPDGDVCAIGQMAVHRWVQAGRDRSEVIDELVDQAEGDSDENVTLEVAESLGIPTPMAQYLAFENDECRVFQVPYRFPVYPTPEQRWERMMRWVRARLAEPPLTRKAKAMPTAERGPRGAGADALRVVEDVQPASEGTLGTAESTFV